MGARVFQLVPAQNEVATFEEAFGEYSEARGRRAERKAKRQEARQERRADRQEARQERKSDRQEARQERKATTSRRARKSRRQEARQERRADRQEARQERRMRKLDLREQRQGSRQERRTMRTAGRIARKGGNLEQGLDVETPSVYTGEALDQVSQPIPETPQTYNDETQGYSDQGYDQGGYSEPQYGGSQGGYSDQGYSDQGYDQGGYDQGGYSEPQYGGGQGGYDYGPEESAPYEDEYYNEEPYGDGYYEEPTYEGEYNEEGNYVGDESGYLADYDTGENFDGDNFSYSNGSALDTIASPVKIKKKYRVVKDINKKGIIVLQKGQIIEGVKAPSKPNAESESIIFTDPVTFRRARLIIPTEVIGLSETIESIDPEIQSAVDKLAWNAECVRRLEKKRKLNPNQAQAISQKILAHKKRYNELKSSLDDYSECCGDYSSADGLEPKRRKIMVKRAWKISQGKIKNAGRPMRPMVNRPADDVVPVAADLKPSFSPNRIVVPGEMRSSYSGTGLNGLDLQNDFDAPEVREVFLGADGSKFDISWGSVLVGVGVGVAAVWAINKYKLLK